MPDGDILVDGVGNIITACGKIVVCNTEITICCPCTGIVGVANLFPAEVPCGELGVTIAGVAEWPIDCFDPDPDTVECGNCGNINALWMVNAAGDCLWSESFDEALDCVAEDCGGGGGGVVYDLGIEVSMGCCEDPDNPGLGLYLIYLYGIVTTQPSLGGANNQTVYYYLEIGVYDEAAGCVILSIDEIDGAVLAWVDPADVPIGCEDDDDINSETNFDDACDFRNSTLTLSV